MLIDNTNSKCECGGKYIETSIHDDIDGVVHCNKCNKVNSRYEFKDKVVDARRKKASLSAASNSLYLRSSEGKGF